MTNEMKKRYQTYAKKAAYVPKIAVAGTSGAGKTTSVAGLLHSFSRQFIYSSIGAIQSSKIRTAIVPVVMNPEESKLGEESLCLYIHLMEFPNTDLLAKGIKKAATDKLVLAYKGYEEDGDAADIVNASLTPEDRMYDISAYCDDELKAKFADSVNEICMKMLGEYEGSSFAGVIDNKRKAAKSKGEPFDKDGAVKSELVKRMIGCGFDKCMEKVIGAIISVIKDKVKEKIEEYCSNMEMEYDKENHTFIVYIDAAHSDDANKLFKYLFEKDGKDMVVSHLTLLAPMSEECKGVFGDKAPLNFMIYDLKGLETGQDSIDETMLKLRESMPDAIVAFHRANEVSNVFVELLKKIQNDYKSVRLDVVLSHCDQNMKSYKRSDDESYEMIKKKKELEGDDEALERLKRERIEAFYRRLKEECSVYEKCVSGSDAKVVYCTLVKYESEEFDACFDFLEQPENKLYVENRFAKLVKEICDKCRKKYQTVDSGYVEPEVVEKIKISFNEARLNEIVANIVKQNDLQADKNYYGQRTLSPHWNTVYKWRDMHRVGSGWTSNAKVYSNISIYVSNFISGFMNRDEIRDAIEIGFPEVPGLGAEQKKTMESKLKENIKTDMADSYFGFFYKLKLWMTYRGFEKEFASTYYGNALDLIKKKLSNSEYINQTMKEVLEDYQGKFLEVTFPGYY